LKRLIVLGCTVILGCHPGDGEVDGGDLEAPDAGCPIAESESGPYIFDAGFAFDGGQLGAGSLFMQRFRSDVCDPRVPACAACIARECPTQAGRCLTDVDCHRCSTACTYWAAGVEGSSFFMGCDVCRQYLEANDAQAVVLLGDLESCALSSCGCL
jgi:hypothetical protein